MVSEVSVGLADVGAKVDDSTDVESGVDEEELALSVGVLLGLVLVRVIDRVKDVGREVELGTV